MTNTKQTPNETDGTPSESGYNQSRIADVLFTTS